MTEPDRLALLEPTLAALRERWGPDALLRLRDLPSASARTPLATGIPEFDHLIGGGLPRGMLASFLSRPTCGATTVALSAAAATQSAGHLVAWFAPGAAPDPGYAAGRGSDLDLLLLVEPEQGEQTWAILGDLLRCGAFGLLIVDAIAMAPPSPASMRRIAASASRSPAAVIFITPQHAPPLPGAGLRLGLERLDWLREGRDITGYTIRATLEKHPHGGEGRSVELTIHLDKLHLPGGRG